VGNSSGDENGSNSVKYWEIIADTSRGETSAGSRP
jgi:hypothetical protein